MLYHGDCLSIMPTLPAQSVDAVICDPPYGTTACKWDSVIPFGPMWRELKRIIKPRGAIVLFGSQPFTSALVMSNPKWFKYSWVWDKKNGGNPMLSKTQPRRIHEDICVFSDGATLYCPQKWQGVMRRRRSTVGELWRGLGAAEYASDIREPVSILPISNAYQHGKEHPTQKPVALMEYLIRTYTNEGDTVLDFTMGVGSTGVGCVNTGRAFIGIEQDGGYFETAQRRITEAQQAMVQMEIAA